MNVGYIEVCMHDIACEILVYIIAIIFDQPTWFAKKIMSTTLFYLRQYDVISVDLIVNICMC